MNQQSPAIEWILSRGFHLSRTSCASLHESQECQKVKRRHGCWNCVCFSFLVFITMRTETSLLFTTSQDWRCFQNVRTRLPSFLEHYSGNRTPPMQMAYSYPALPEWDQICWNLQWWTLACHRSPARNRKSWIHWNGLFSPIHSSDELIPPQIPKQIWCEFVHKTIFLVPKWIGGWIAI